MTRRILLLLLPLLAFAADPYAAWSQGRPVEAVAPLIAAARANGRWDAWLDAGLAAAAAGDRGRAVACLAQAHAFAPERPEPRDSLRSLAVPLPTTWCERAGPFALPGLGWSGVVLGALAGLGLGGAWFVGRGRGVVLSLSVALALVAAPGVLAMRLDDRTAWIAAVRDTSTLDSTGAPQRELPAGTLLERLPQPAWGSRMLVRLPDGSSAYVAAADITP